MRKTVGLILLLLTTLVSFSQYGTDYMMIMVKQKKAMHMATTVPAFQDLANNFERISNAESDKWHPLYYAAFCYVNMNFLSKDAEKKDEYLDKAQQFLDKAIEIYPEESELFVLQGLLYQGKLQVDPGERSKEYFVLAGETLNKARSFNPGNPRVYYLIGLNLLYSHESIGGGAEGACPFFQTAIEKYADNIPEHVLSPSWGGEENHKIYNKYCSDIE